MFVLKRLLAVLTAAVGLVNPRVRRVEAELPDAVVILPSRALRL